MKITIQIDNEALDDVFRDELRRAYIDQITIWKSQPASKEYAAALLKVIEYYSVPTEFVEWKQSVGVES